MEVFTIVMPILLILALSTMFWILWQIRRSVKEIRHSLEELTTGLTLLTDQLTILLYLEIKERPDLLERAPDLEQRALEAAKRLGQKQLPSRTGR